MTVPARSTVLAVLLLALIGMVLPVAAVDARPAGGGLGVSAPGAGTIHELFAVSVSLPPDVTAFDGRVLVAAGAAEVVGLAPSGSGSGLRPEAVTDGFAIGAFGLDQPAVEIVIEPLRPGRLEIRVVIDTAADATGARLELNGTEELATIRIAGGNQLLHAPNANGGLSPTRRAGKARDLLRDGRFDIQDVDYARGAWVSARATGNVCGPTLEGDVNGDDCVDIADIQALDALQGETTTPDPSSAVVAASLGAASSIGASSSSLSGASLRTFTVTSALDTPDVAPGNGVCADSLGRCTLRAAMAEANGLDGLDTIAFNLPGPAPVTIQLASALPYITARSGGVIIDGYTQPGSSPNTVTFGSNAVPGVEIRGNGQAAREVGFYVTSPGNTIRGLVIGNVWRGVFVDGLDAHDNSIVGDWIGFTRDGGLATSMGEYGVVLNTGSTNNHVGTPGLADRNVIGNFGTAIDHYGTGTNGNVEQNNLLCIRPNGLRASCSTGVDHNFGPKNGLVGGTGPNERNVIGPTTFQGIEYSHGWNPASCGQCDNSFTWQVDNNRAVANWVGFKADGSYDPLYRSAQQFSNSDNGQGINVYDGSNDNLVEGNYVASGFDGIQTMAPNAQRNIIRNNFIGQSPLGQAAPMAGWGVVVRWGGKFDVVESNSIQNAAKGGIGLLNTNNQGAAMSPAYNIRLTRNIITGTTGPAIDLFGIAGPDPRSPTGHGSGANTVPNPPVLTSVTTTAIAGTGFSGATIEVYRASRGVGAYGLPIEYLGSAVAASNGAWTLARSSIAGDVVTALQILADQNTSEFAANVAVGGGGGSQAPAITSANAAGFTVGLAGTFTVTTTARPSATITESGALPGGVTFADNGNGSATLAGTPAAGTDGTYAITFTAANGVSPDATQTFTLTINAATPGAPFAQDSFTRTVAGGWGTAPTGGSWTVSSGSVFAVNGSDGTMTLTAGATRYGRLGSVRAGDADMSVEVSTNKVPVGGSLFVYLVGRQAAVNTEYRMKVRVAADGRVYVQPTRSVGGTEASLGSEYLVPGVKAGPAVTLGIRGQFFGSSPTTIRMRVWDASLAEPSGWATTQTDSRAELQGPGAVGLRAYLASAVTNPPAVLSFDDLSVIPYP